MIFYPYMPPMGEAASGICSINETLTVLFVDDELAMREIVQEMFSEDFAVRTALFLGGLGRVHRHRPTLSSSSGRRW
jgi:hypothetical protein